ncbi:LAFA_0E05160g1_1 [Lachancea sp. 'fantastica']|nr:LAFA_0E05160g1_1 [Lachancea sp. 'fantastica']
MSSVWDRIREEQVVEALQVPQSSSSEQQEERTDQNEHSVWSSEEEEELDDEDINDSDLYTDDMDFEQNLLTAQQQWEESLEQLSQVLNWVLLPLVGKYLGRRTALGAWKRIVTYLWGI